MLLNKMMLKALVITNNDSWKKKDNMNIIELNTDIIDNILSLKKILSEQFSDNISLEDLIIILNGICQEKGMNSFIYNVRIII